MLAKWGRRGKNMSVQPKGKYASLSAAMQAQAQLWNDHAKDGYLDIESDHYQKHMGSMTIFPKIDPLTLQSPGIKEHLEYEDGTIFPVVPRSIVWQCESCGKDWMPILNDQGYPDKTQNNVCPECHKKILAIAKKRTEKGEDEVMVCVDNTGMDDRFDVGIEYLVEDHKDKTLIYAYDKLGKKGEFFKKRFLTPEQWAQKQGKIVVNMIKNRESSEDAQKILLSKEIQAGDKIRTINPWEEMRNHLKTPQARLLLTVAVLGSGIQWLGSFV